MVGITFNRFMSADRNYREFAGLSTDAKPTVGLITGSLFLEVDTGDVYAWDEEGSEWHKVCALGGDS